MYPFQHLNIYNSLISPYLTYGLVAWGQAAKSHIKKILILQKRVLRLMNFASFNSHAVPYFISSNILPVNMLYFKLASLLMLDVYHNVTHSNLSDLFTSTYKVHNYNTRSSAAGSYYVDHSQIDHLKTSFSRMGPRIWNSIPEYLRKLPKHIFKKKITAILFEILRVQDTCVDIQDIIDNISKQKEK